jgi:hypothetical protein
MQFMHTRSKLLLAALTAALALTLGVSTANASRSFSSINNTLLTYVSPALTFQGSGGNRHICAVTLTASLHSIARKSIGELVGFVNGGRAERCRNNLGSRAAAIPLVSHARPWHITYNSFRGTLPRITEILVTINDARFLLELETIFFGIQRCLYEGDILTETTGTTGAAEYTIRLLIPQRGLNIAVLVEEALTSSSVECEESGELVGTFHATLPPVVRLL